MPLDLLRQSFQYEISCTLLDFFGNYSYGLVFIHWFCHTPPRADCPLFVSIILHLKEAHGCPEFIESTLGELSAGNALKPFDGSPVGIGRRTLRIVKILSFDLPEVNFPVKFRRIEDEITKFHLAHEPHQLPRHTRNGTRFRSRKHICNTGLE